VPKEIASTLSVSDGGKLREDVSFNAVPEPGRFHGRPMDNRPGDRDFGIRVAARNHNNQYIPGLQASVLC
jgi:hypothetical protein